MFELHPRDPGSIGLHTVNEEEENDRQLGWTDVARADDTWSEASAEDVRERVKVMSETGSTPKTPQKEEGGMGKERSRRRKGERIGGTGGGPRSSVRSSGDDGCDGRRSATGFGTASTSASARRWSSSELPQLSTPPRRLSTPSTPNIRPERSASLHALPSIPSRCTSSMSVFTDGGGLDTRQLLSPRALAYAELAHSVALAASAVQDAGGGKRRSRSVIVRNKRATRGGDIPGFMSRAIVERAGRIWSMVS